MSVEETRDALKALRDDGVAVDRIVVNRLTQPPPQRCAWCSARRRVEQQALGRLEQDRLCRRASRSAPCDGRRAAGPAGARADGPTARSDERRRRVRRRHPSGARRAVATAGQSPNGGGRAAARHRDHEAVDVRRERRRRQDDLRRGAAIRIAADRRRPRVLLLSTDPAHSLGDVFGERLSDAARPIKGGPSNLLVREIDARRGFAALRERFALGDRRAGRSHRRGSTSAAQRPGTIGR